MSEDERMGELVLLLLVLLPPHVRRAIIRAALEFDECVPPRPSRPS